MSWAAPGTGATGTALWLTYLSGSAEQAALMLTRLAGRGLLAVSFDPSGHGRRGDGSSPERLAGEVNWPGMTGRPATVSLVAVCGGARSGRAARGR